MIDKIEGWMNGQIDRQTIIIGFGEMAQWVICLSCYHEDLKLNPLHLCKEYQYGSVPLQSQHVPII